MFSYRRWEAVSPNVSRGPSANTNRAGLPGAVSNRSAAAFPALHPLPALHPRRQAINRSPGKQAGALATRHPGLHLVKHKRHRTPRLCPEDKSFACCTPVPFRCGWKAGYGEQATVQRRETG